MSPGHCLTAFPDGFWKDHRSTGIKPPGAVSSWKESPQDGVHLLRSAVLPTLPKDRGPFRAENKDPITQWKVIQRGHS